jgi:uncharacterized peroxidase-related enzyme
MAFIKTIHEREATGELAEWYKRVGNPDGTVDNVMKIHSLNPDTLRTHFEMYTAAMHKPSPLSCADREMVAVAVSRLNGCKYCLRHHHAGLVRLLPADRRTDGDALAEGRSDGLDDRERAMIDYAVKLTQTPQQMNRADIESLRTRGLDDRAILDLAQCVGYFCYVNRIVTGLGVELGTDEGPAGQWPGSGPV